MNKNYFICVFVFLFIGCHSTIYKMELSYVDMNIDTFMRVNCEDFEKDFIDIMKVILISDQTIIKNILDLLDDLSPVDMTKYPSPDTRRKMRIWKNNEIHIVVCMDSFTILYDGRSYEYKGELRDILESMIEKNNSNITTATN